jgi:hypothetical protein
MCEVKYNGEAVAVHPHLSSLKLEIWYCQSTVIADRQLVVAHLIKKFPPLYGRSSYSQEAYTGHYLKPDDPRPQLHILFFKNHSASSCM